MHHFTCKDCLNGQILFCLIQQMEKKLTQSYIINTNFVGVDPDFRHIWDRAIEINCSIILSMQNNNIFLEVIVKNVVDRCFKQLKIGTCNSLHISIFIFTIQICENMHIYDKQ